MDKVLHTNVISSEDKRIIVGISGHGASGKTTFAHGLLKLLGHDDLNYINTGTYIIGSHKLPGTLWRMRAVENHLEKFVPAVSSIPACVKQRAHGFDTLFLLRILPSRVMKSCE